MPELKKLAERMGAEVVGADLRQMDDATFRWLHQAFLDHIFVVVRDQELTIPQFLDIGARFGPLRPHLVKKSRHPDYPDLMIMDNKVADTRTRQVAAQTDVTLVKLATTWHTDMSYEIDRPIATQMYSLAVPSTGGDTPFVNMYTAYELSLIHI